ncbi:MAG: TPM domain-containing protein [Acidaminococcaceae bacterium]|jgi:uncharacterized protein|nr:TPM domain-containing protein [Acidaminococcaceae bacterium]MCI2109692.1 TPM domain-containing protein [Acidaminococcaceae bacterium]
MKKYLILLTAILQLCFFLPVKAFSAPKIPAKPTTSIYVQDKAKVLSASTKNTINAYSAALAAKTKSQIVVVTVPTLDGEALEDYSLSIVRNWGIGDKEKNNGVLLLIAVKDRKSRIEVGYGLEGALPDGLTGRIQDQYMLPYFRKGDYDKGILNGYSAVFNTVLKEYKLSAKDLNMQGRVQPEPGNTQKGSLFTLSNGLVLLIIIILLIVDRILFGGAIFRFIFYMLLFRGGGRGGGGGFGGGGFGGGSGGGGGSSRDW